MSWAKLDDQFADHPKLGMLGPLGPLAGWLFVCGLCYCARYLTDGFIPQGQISKLADLSEQQWTSTQLRDALIAAELWEQAAQGVIVHDYLAYNPPREQVLAERDAAKKRMQFRRSSGERPPNNDGSSLSPVPVPVPVPPSRSRTPESEHSSATNADASEFDTFWGAYPRKAGKGAARTAYTKARKKADADAILTGLRLHLPGWQSTEARFIPNPATWLNQERWSDTPSNGTGVPGNVARALALVDKYAAEEAGCE